MLNKYLAVPLSLTLLSTTTLMPGEAVAETRAETQIKNSEKQKKAEAAFASGMRLKKDGNTGGALLEFIKAANANPRMLDAYYEQALIFKEQKLLKLSASRLEQALAIDPEYKKGRVLLATIAIEQGNVGEAINQLGKTLEKKKEVGPNTIADATILQQIHTGISTPAKTESTQTPELKTKKKTRWSRGKTKRKRKEKRISRKKIRAAIAKRYRRFHKVYKKPRQAKPWYTRIFAWASPFQKSRNNRQLLVDTSTDTDLVKKGDPLLARSKPSQEKEQLANLNASAVYRQEKTRPVRSFNSKKETRGKDKIEEKALDALLKSAPMTSSTELVAPALGLADILSPEKRLKKEPESTTVSLKTEKPKQESRPLPAKRAVPKLTYIPAIRNSSQLKTEKKVEKPFEPPVKDKWTVKLTALNKNGTGSLKRGEAFMFSEDTGEAVLFLADGRRIRRIIAPQQSTEKIVKLRRPDVLVPKELFYDLSLLGKVVANKPVKKRSEQLTPQTSITMESAEKTEPPTFHMEKLMDESRTFIGVVRDALRL